LSVVFKKTSGDKFILWPFLRYCHPIWMQFKNETAELAKEEISVVEEQINKLEKPVITVEEQNSVIYES
jgi:hypothetical protein